MSFWDKHLSFIIQPWATLDRHLSAALHSRFTFLRDALTVIALCSIRHAGPCCTLFKGENLTHLFYTGGAWFMCVAGKGGGK